MFVFAYLGLQVATMQVRFTSCRICFRGRDACTPVSLCPCTLCASMRSGLPADAVHAGKAHTESSIPPPGPILTLPVCSLCHLSLQHAFDFGLFFSGIPLAVLSRAANIGLCSRLINLW